MQTPALVSTDQYLITSFEYDKEYIEGKLIERSMPNELHGSLQAEILGWLVSRRREGGVRGVGDCRVRITPNRYRIPDVCAVSSRRPPAHTALKIAPVFVIEILSPDDSLASLRAKAHDYLSLGIPHVLVRRSGLRRMP